MTLGIFLLLMFLGSCGVCVWAALKIAADLYPCE